MTKSIGIVGGLGAAAGAHFFSQLIEEFQNKGAKRDSDFPEIFLHSLQSEGLDNHGIAEWDTLEMELASSISRINSCGADVIIIACNTAHVYLDRLQKSSRAEILNMIDIACESTEGMKVGVIASRTTNDEHLYDKALAKHGALALRIAPDQQESVDEIISRVISGNSTLGDAEDILHISETLKYRGADKVILGCTELPLVIPHMAGDDFFIDPGRKTIARAMS